MFYTIMLEWSKKEKKKILNMKSQLVTIGKVLYVW